MTRIFRNLEYHPRTNRGLDDCCHHGRMQQYFQGCHHSILHLRIITAPSAKVPRTRSQDWSKFMVWKYTQSMMVKSRCCCCCFLLFLGCYKRLQLVVRLLLGQYLQRQLLTSWGFVGSLGAAWTIVNSHQPSLITVNHHQLLSTIDYYSCTSFNHT